MNELQVFSFIVQTSRTGSCLEARYTLKISMKRTNSASKTIYKKKSDRWQHSAMVMWILVDNLAKPPSMLISKMCINHVQVAVSQGCTTKEKTWYDLIYPHTITNPSHPHISIRLKSLREARPACSLLSVRQQEGTACSDPPSDEWVANLEPLGMSEGG